MAAKLGIWFKETPDPRWLLSLTLVLLMTAAVLYWAQPSPVLQQAWYFGAPYTVKYQMRGTVVSIEPGDLIDSESPYYIDSDVLAFATKRDLGNPYQKSSFDFKFFQSMCPDYRGEANFLKQPERCRSYIDWRTAEKSNPGPRGLILPTEFKSNERTIAFVAAVENEKAAADLDPLDRANRLTTATAGVLKHIEKDFSLAMPVMGTGAGGIPKPLASEAILQGINQAILAGNAPTSVTVAVYPGKSATDFNEKEQATVTLNTFEKLITNGDTTVWSQLGYWRLSIQTILVAAMPLIGALIGMSLPEGKRRITKGALVNSMVFFLLIACGVKLGQASGLVAMPTPAFLFLLVAGLVLPIWKWMEYGSVNKPNEDS